MSEEFRAAMKDAYANLASNPSIANLHANSPEVIAIVDRICDTIFKSLASYAGALTQKAKADATRREQVRAAGPIRLAFDALEKVNHACRFHGTDFTRAGTRYGIPNCDSCKEPYYAKQALVALRTWMNRTTLDVESRNVV